MEQGCGLGCGAGIGLRLRQGKVAHITTHTSAAINLCLELQGFERNYMRFRRFLGQYVFWAGLASERRKASHASQNQVTAG